MMSCIMKCIPIAQSDGEENAQRLALLALGEIGRSTDLSSYSNLQTIILGAHGGHLKTRPFQYALTHIISSCTCIHIANLYTSVSLWLAGGVACTIQLTAAAVPASPVPCCFCRSVQECQIQECHIHIANSMI